MCLILELAINGDLYTLLHEDNNKKKTLDLSQRLSIAKDIAKGLWYLHSFDPNCKIVHRDIKSQNILVRREQ